MKVSIKWALFFAFTFVIIISISFIITSSYLTSKDALLEHSKSVMETIITFTIDKSKNHILAAKDASELTQGLTTSKIVNTEDFEGMEKYFFEQLKVNYQFSNIYYGNSQGDFIMVSRDSKDSNSFKIKKIIIKDGLRVVTLKTIDSKFNLLSLKPMDKDTYDPRTRPWYQASIKDTKTIWTDPYVFFESKSLGITAASHVLNKQNETIGAVGVDIELKELSTFLSKIDFYKVGKVFIFDKHLNLIASDKAIALQEKDHQLIKIDQLQNPELNTALNTLLKKTSLEKIEAKEFISFSYNDDNYHAIFSPFEINDIKWVIGIYITENAYLGDIKKSQILNIYIAIFICILFLYLSYKIAHSISKPILQMQHTAHELKLHRLNVPKISLSAFTEINESIEAFNDMKDELIRYEDETNNLNLNLKKAYLDTLYKLAIAAEYKDGATANHIHRIGQYSEIMAKQMNMNEDDVYSIRHASIMHDVGKLGISDAILLKPGKLTTEEMEVMKTHSLLGSKILSNSNSKIMKDAYQIALHHHEKWDGTGYPDNLKGEQIPLMARIVSVVDVFDALVSKRCYKEAFSIECALQILRDGKGKHFDPACIDAFEQSLESILEIYYKDQNNRKKEEI